MRITDALTKRTGVIPSREQIQTTLTAWLARTTAVFAVHHAVIFLIIFIVLGYFFYWGPGALEHSVAMEILAGRIPYIDFPSEYPPVTLVSFILPALFARTIVPYSIAYAIEILLMDLAVVALIANTAHRLKLWTGGTLLLYTLILVAIGPIIIARHDMLPAMLVMASVYAFTVGRCTPAWGLLALGVGAKVYPLIIAPLYGLYHLRHKQYRELFIGGAIFLAVIIITILPWLILDPKSLTYVLTYHGQRGLQCESTYATVLLLGQVLKLTEVQGIFNYGSWNVTSPLADKIAAQSFYLLAGALLLVYALYAWSLWRRRETVASPVLPLDGESTRQLFVASALLVTVFIVFNKVLSPQYLIWLAPLLPLVTGRYYHPVWILFLIAAAITQYIFPYHYLRYELFIRNEVIILFIRNLLLAAVMVLLALNLFPPARTKQLPGLREV